MNANCNSRCCMSSMKWIHVFVVTLDVFVVVWTHLAYNWRPSVVCYCCKCSNSECPNIVVVQKLPVNLFQQLFDFPHYLIHVYCSILTKIPFNTHKKSNNNIRWTHPTKPYHFNYMSMSTFLLPTFAIVRLTNPLSLSPPPIITIQSAPPKCPIIISPPPNSHHNHRIYWATFLYTKPTSTASVWINYPKYNEYLVKIRRSHLIFQTINIHEIRFVTLAWTKCIIV